MEHQPDADHRRSRPHLGRWIAARPPAVGTLVALGLFAVASAGIELVHEQADRAIHAAQRHSLPSVTNASAFAAYERDVHVATGMAFAFAAVVSAGLGIGTCLWHGRRIERSREVHAMNERMERVTENVPGGVFICEEGPDVPGRLTFASRGLREVCAPSAPSAGQPHALLDMIHPDDRAIAGCALDCCRADQSTWRGEYRSVDGARWIEIRARPERRPDGSCHWHGFVADVTDRKHAEVALREAKARAERASRI